MHHVAQLHLRLPRIARPYCGKYKKKGNRSQLSPACCSSLYILNQSHLPTLHYVAHRKPHLAGVVYPTLRPTVPHTTITPCRSTFFLATEFSASGMQHQRAQFFPDPSLPPGQADLEALERLKEIIKNNQHEIFRATPRPAALASLYRGTLPSVVPPHPEQVPNSAKEKSTSTPSSLSFEKPSSSSAHIVSAVQGPPSIGGQSRSGASSGTVRVLLPSHRRHSLTLSAT